MSEHSPRTIREAVSPYLPIYIFLLAYFGLTAFGNLLYATSFGADLPAINITDFSWDKVDGEFTMGFWFLLALPFILAPFAILVRNLAEQTVEATIPYVQEIPGLLYVVATTVLYVFAIYRLAEVHALSRFLSAHDAVNAVESRFDLLAAIGFKTQIVLKSLLVFLSVYGAVRASREQGWFWPVVTAVNVIILTTCLTILNMKWPSVVFIVTLGICVFVSAKRHPYVKAGAVLVLGALLYVTLSVVLLRWFPAPDEVKAPVGISVTAPSTESAPIIELGEQPLSDNRKISIGGTAEGVAAFAPRILVGALNRMAVAVPYYYDFSSPCAPSLERLWIKRERGCEPTLLVYTRLFGDDGFAGRGTAPAAVNLYGYALGGWPGAIVSTLIAMAVLGLFLALWKPAQINSVFMAAFVMGCYTAYFFSQLPVEGPLIYDHGLWWVFLVMAWVGYAALKSPRTYQSISTTPPT